MKPRCAEMTTIRAGDEPWRKAVFISASYSDGLWKWQWSLKYPVNLLCSLALAEHLVHSEIILELILANLPILCCFFCLSCNWFMQYCRHLLSYPSVSGATFVIVV